MILSFIEGQLSQEHRLDRETRPGNFGNDIVCVVTRHRVWAWLSAESERLLRRMFWRAILKHGVETIRLICLEHKGIELMENTILSFQSNVFECLTSWMPLLWLWCRPLAQSSRKNFPIVIQTCDTFSRTSDKTFSVENTLLSFFFTYHGYFVFSRKYQLFRSHDCLLLPWVGSRRMCYSKGIAFWSVGSIKLHWG